MLLAVDDPDEMERYLMARPLKLQAILEAAEKRFDEGKGIPAAEFWARMKRRQEAKAKTNGKRPAKAES